MFPTVDRLKSTRVEGMATTSAQGKVTSPEDLGCIHCNMVTNSTNSFYTFA
jgi:hypothetical protein